MIVDLRIRTYGKASRYGENVYKVGEGALILARNGWQIVRRPSMSFSYTYMRSPIVQRSKFFVVQVDIPTDEELLSFAEELHRRGEEFSGEFKGWAVRYTPRRVSAASSRMVVSDGMTMFMPVAASESPATFNCYGDGWGFFVSFENPVRTHKDGDFVGS
jgi:hypothetical protein